VKGIGDLMKQAQEMQGKLQEAQAQMAAIEVQGESGAGMVKVTMNCRYEVKRVEIDPSLLSEDKAILEDLLSLARIEQESEQRQLEMEPVRLAGLLRAAAETCSARAEKRNADIEVACPDYLVIPVNESLLEQALVNLIDNAIKYGPEGGKINVRAQRVSEEVILSVQDHGAGIQADHLPRIFERFYRTDRARSRELGGTGLGLAIVKHIAAAHGGRVSVDSTPGRGSTFRIHLPTL